MVKNPPANAGDVDSIPGLNRSPRIKKWRARFHSTYTKIGTIQRRLAWPLRKDDMQIREAFHIFWCTGTTQREGLGREEGGGFRMGSTGIPVADSFRCLAKLIQYCKA